MLKVLKNTQPSTKKIHIQININNNSITSYDRNIIPTWMSKWLSSYYATIDVCFTLKLYFVCFTLELYFQNEDFFRELMNQYFYSI